MTSLMLAAEYGHADCVKALIAARADADAKNDNGMTALSLAVECSNRNSLDAIHGRTAEGNGMDCVDALIAAHAEVNWKDHDGEPLLSSSCWCGNLAAVKALIAAHADVNARDNKGDTPLRYIERRNDYANQSDIIAALKAAGATE